MVERLVHALQVLAAPPDIQLARIADLAVTAKELALDVDDALRLVYDCPQLELDALQREHLDRLEQFLDERSGLDAFWTESAIRSSAEWVALRELAGAALGSLGAPRALPALGGDIRIRGART